MMGYFSEYILKLEDQAIQKKQLQLQKERDQMIDRHFSTRLKTEVSEAEKQRTFSSVEAGKQRSWQGTQFGLNRAQESSENRLNRLLTRSEGRENRALTAQEIASRENIAGAELNEKGRQFDLTFDLNKAYNDANVKAIAAGTEAQLLKNLFERRSDVQGFRTQILNNEALLSKEQVKSAKARADLEDTQTTKIIEMLYGPSSDTEKQIALGFITNNAEANLLRRQTEQDQMQLEMLGRTNAMLQTLLGVETQKSRDAMTALGVASNPVIMKYMVERLKDPEVYHKSLFGNIGEFIGLPSGTEYRAPGSFLKRPGEPESMDFDQDNALRDVSESLKESLGL